MIATFQPDWSLPWRPSTGISLFCPVLVSSFLLELNNRLRGPSFPREGPWPHPASPRQHSCHCALCSVHGNLCHVMYQEQHYFIIGSILVSASTCGLVSHLHDMQIICGQGQGLMKNSCTISVAQLGSAQLYVFSWGLWNSDSPHDSSLVLHAAESGQRLRPS